MVLASMAIIFVSLFNFTLSSPLALAREQSHDANNLANLRGFVNDLKSKLRGEFALLMALEGQEEELEEPRPQPSRGGLHPLRNRPLPFGIGRDRRTDFEDVRPQHPLAGWGSLLNNN
jgi:hypothetical protein